MCRVIIKPVRIHTEHAYADALNCIFEKEYVPNINCKLYQFLKYVDKNISSFYMNHIVLELDNGLFLGVNDGYLRLSTKMMKSGDSKIINLPEDQIKKLTIIC